MSSAAGVKYETGGLVAFRGRDWVVLPPLHDGALLLKPLGGTDAEIVEISPELEEVASASFPPPDPSEVGDARSCAILRDAVRLGMRSTTGPFRSFGHIAAEPRPYQLVPLLMALKQDVVRLLIADDVGIGKTVEALLIARELLDRGEIRRLAVLCPPPLAEQWQKELAEKFHIEAETVLPSTVSRLERGLGAGTSLFEKYPFTIVSLDFIKSERHRLDFIRACPECVIVDEAHACASASGGRGGKQRYDLVRSLAANPDRHMIFVTATPHSGKEDVFRSLLAFLKPEFAELPDDLAGKEHAQKRKELAEFFVQRRRGDIRAYMDEKTPFPERMTQEMTWEADAGWNELFQEALSLARASIASRMNGSLWQQRVCWWSALALLRAVSSSPAAAVQTLRTRAQGVGEEENIKQLDQMGSQCIFDQYSSDESVMPDTQPGADASEEGNDCGNEKPAMPETPTDTDASSGKNPAGSENPEMQDTPPDTDADPGKNPAGPAHSRYTALARKAEDLKGKKDTKLQKFLPVLKELLNKGYSPVIFCRFIPTAEYLAEELRKELPKCAVEQVTGILPPAEREARVIRLEEKEKRILVCTDCLSEGINLQHSFNAVVHYDLSWNPTRHEQREGRVDRFGQSMPEVRVITWWGKDNPMDGMVLDVLLRKHESIRRSLGVSVPVPDEGEKVIETLLQGLLLRGKKKKRQLLQLPGVEEFQQPEMQRMAEAWDEARRREEKRSRTFFAQKSIKTEAVKEALDEAAEAGGSSQTVEDFVTAAWERIGGVRQKESSTAPGLRFSFDDLTRTKHQGLTLPENGEAFVFRLPAKPGQTCLSRTHPLVEQLAAYLAETTLDPHGERLLARCGVMRTKSVSTRTTLLLCRFRFQICATGDLQYTSLAEECTALAFAGAPRKAQWLPEEDVPGLLAARPAENVSGGQASDWIAKVTGELPLLLSHIEEVRRRRADKLLRSHRGVRNAAKLRRVRYSVTPQGYADILGIYIYLPVIG